MAKVKIQGNASGTGVLTISAPNTNANRTITLPDGDVTMGVGIDDNATSTAITIDNSGRLIMGATSTIRSCKQYLEGNGNAIEFQAETNTTVYPLVFRNYSGNDVGYITYTASSTTYNTSSDYRLKENVVPMTGSIDRLKTLKPSRFNFIVDADTTVDGFLAHEAQEVVPEAITGTKDAMTTEEYEVTPAVMDGEDVVTEAVMGEREVEDYQGIDQSKLVPLLVASLQEAVARIEALEEQLSKEVI
jgi:hypothetical protein